MKQLTTPIQKLKNKYHPETFDAIKNAPFSIPWPISAKTRGEELKEIFGIFDNLIWDGRRFYQGKSKS